MVAIGRLITGATVAKGVFFEDAGFFEQFDSPVDGGQRDFRVGRYGAVVDVFDIGMVFGIFKHGRDRPPLVGHPQSGGFTTRKGPVFANLVLADEINRAPAKVQSALLEAMQEKQVTLGKETFDLPHPFLVLATQNPIEQEGTYALPEAQVDRFMFKLKVGYPTLDEEHEIMRRMARAKPELSVDSMIDLQQVLEMRDLVDEIFMDEAVERYILKLVDATRNPGNYGLEIERYVRFGASPRATIYLSLAARAEAMLRERDYVSPDDIQAMIHDVMRHRVLLSYEAEADGVTVDELVDRLLDRVPVP